MSDSSSDSERESRLPPRGRAAAAARDDSDDSDEDETRPKVLTRGSAARPGAAKGKDSDSDTDSDSDDDGPSVPNRRPGAAADSDSDSDESDEEDNVAPRRQVQLWTPIDYDAMSADDFYQLLKQKSRAARIDEKRLYDEQVAQQQEEEELIEHFIDDANKGYTYSQMLQRVFGQIRVNNPELGDGSHKKVKLPVPKTEKSGSKKTALTNFKEMCRALSREMDHVKDFIEKHLTTTSSVDGNNCLIMKIQNVKPAQIEGVFQKYVEEFCQCGNCGGIDTELTKDSNSRLWNLKCRSCRAGRTVQAATNATYQATTTRRARLRQRGAL